MNLHKSVLSVKNNEELLVLIMLWEALGEGAALGGNVMVVMMAGWLAGCFCLCLSTQHKQERDSLNPFYHSKSQSAASSSSAVCGPR